MNNLKTEIKGYLDGGLPSEVVAIRIYATLIDSSLIIEQQKIEINNLRATAVKLTKQLNKEISDIVRYATKTPRPC